MKIELTTQEIALLMELMQNWKTHRPYNVKDFNIINGIVNKIYLGSRKDNNVVS